MKYKIDAVVDLGDRTDREIKRGWGGIREIEFLIHAQQLLHGAHNRQLRPRSTLKALDALRDGKHVDAETAAELWEDYIRRRRVETRRQM